MIDEMDYKEPNCPLCDGKQFYDPDPNEPTGHIDVRRVLDKVDACFSRRDWEGAGRLLEYWRNEAELLRDRSGELSMVNELVGFYRKAGNQEKAFENISRAMVLLDRLEQGNTVSGGTVLVNCATAYKAFGMASMAMPLYRRAKALYSELLPAEDARVGGLYNNMALALVDLGEYEEASVSYGEALAVMARVENGEADMAVTYVNMAHLHEEKGERDEIVPCMTRAYALLKSESLPKDGYYAFVCEKCAPSFGHFGFYSLEKELKQLSEEIYERA